MSATHVREGRTTKTAGEAIAEGLCVVQSSAANNTVLKPTTGLTPVYVTDSAATAANESIDVVPISSNREMRVRTAGAITRGDLCEITLSGSDAGKIVTLATGAPRFVALETAASGDLALVLPIGASSRQVTGQGAPSTLNATGTFADGDFRAGIITSTTAAAVAGTTRTGTQLDAEFPEVPVNGAIEFVIINTGGSNAFTLTAGTGITIVGAAAVAASTSGRFRARKTATATWTIYRI